MPGPWRRRSAFSTRSGPYYRRAPVDWLTQTQACQQYGLKPADLDAISPLEVVKNPHGGRHPMKKFSRYQVEALARRLDFEKSLAVEIVRTRAMEKYDLTASQMDTLIPIRTAPNPHKPGTEMRFYSVKDVEKLVEKVKAANQAAEVYMAAQAAQTAPAAGSSSSVAGPSHPATGPSSSQTTVTSEQSFDDDEDEFGDGGFDDSILSQIELPPA